MICRRSIIARLGHTALALCDSVYQVIVCISILIILHYTHTHAHHVEVPSLARSAGPSHPIPSQINQPTCRLTPCRLVLPIEVGSRVFPTATTPPEDNVGDVVLSFGVSAASRDGVLKVGVVPPSVADTMFQQLLASHPRAARDLIRRESLDGTFFFRLIWAS